MMTRLRPFTLLITCAAITAQGQVAFSYPDALPEQGQHSFITRSATWSGYSAAPPWNVEALSFTTVGPRTLVWAPASMTPFAAQFPQATDCMYDPTQVPAYYDYFQVAPASVAYWGSAELGSAEVYTDPFAFRVFPMMLATGYNDEFVLDGDTIFGAVNPLAKGDLLTPFGDLTNVVLTEVVVNSGLGAEFSYLFYREGNSIMPVAQYDQDDQTMILYTPGIISPLQVPEFGAPSVSLGPNPAPNGTATLRWTGAAIQADLRIIAADGRMVHQQNVVSGPNGSIDLDLSALTPGTYAVRMDQVGEVLWQERLVVVR